MEEFVNWRRYPFVRLIFPFAIGILAADKSSIFPNYTSVIVIITALAVGFLLNAFRSNRKLVIFNGFYLYLLFFCLGLFAFRMHEPSLSETYYAKYLNRQPTTMMVRVDDTEMTENWFKLYGSVIKTRDSLDFWKKTNGNILLYAAKDSSHIMPGSVLLIRSKVLPIAESKNPGSFDFKAFLKRKYIDYQVFAQEGEWLLTDLKMSTISIEAAKIRLHLIEVLKSYIPSEREYSVAAALILGYRNDVSDELSNAYINTGSIHILAVSGLHVGLVSGVIMLLLSFISKNNLTFRIIKLCIILIAIWFFVLVTGAGASVIRAAVMFSLIHVGQVFYRRKYIYNTIAASAFVIFLWNPQLLFDVGFHLSMVAVLGIIALQPVLNSLWNPSSKVVRFFWDLSTVTLAAQIATLPLTLFYFHQTSLYFLLSGIFVVPISSIALYAGIGVFAFSFILPAAAKLASIIMYGSLFAMNSAIFGILKLPYNLITNIPFNGWEFFVLSVSMILGILFLNLRSKSLLYTSVFLFFLFAIIRIYFDYSHQSQRLLIFYSSKERVFIDYFHGNNCISLRESNDPIQEKYVASGARMQHRILESKTINLITNYPGFYSASDQTLQAQGFKMKFISKNINNLYGISPGTCVYVCDDVTIEGFNSELLPSEVLLGSALNYKTKKIWKNFCESNHIKCIDLKTESLLKNI